MRRARRARPFTAARRRSRGATQTALDLVARNVAKAVKAPPVPHRQVRALHPDEARRLVDVLRGERLEGVFACGLMLGLRRGEILGLRWADVDLDGATLYVRQTLRRPAQAGGAAVAAAA
ncbi:hypothetical protein AB1484_01645 [Parafrankia sp. FMc6]|uniref:hypothetical protein n=1 Tax=Parafrankia soli TaxID=2599596 RepID=UPI0034D626A5